MLCAVLWSRPNWLPILALLSVFATQRLGGSVVPSASGGLSYSDAFLSIAAFFAVPIVVGTPELQRLQTVGLGVALTLAA